MFNPKPIHLTIGDIQLLPLTLECANDFYHCANHDEIWTWKVPNPCTSLAATKKWIDQALQERDTGTQVPFIIIDKLSGNMAGSTRYLNIDKANKKLEIGHTFLAPQFWRTHVNSQNKLCLLQHAFEDLRAIRVEFRTNENNQRSRNAISRLGAQLEGIMRQDRILPTGKLRSTALFSIIDSQWSEVKTSLINKIELHQLNLPNQRSCQS